MHVADISTAIDMSAIGMAAGCRTAVVFGLEREAASPIPTAASGAESRAKGPDPGGYGPANAASTQSAAETGFATGESGRPLMNAIERSQAAVSTAPIPWAAV